MTASDPVVVRTRRLVVLDLYSRPEVVRFLGSSATPMGWLEQAVRGIARAREHNAEAPAGTVAVVPVADDPEGALAVAWHLHPDSQGLGYATEAARAVLSRVLALGTTEVLALVAPANLASLAVTRRLRLDPRGRTERYYGMPLEVFVSRGADDAAAGVGAAGFRSRAGSVADTPLVVGLFDEAVQWMVSRGLTDQWGEQPFSADPRRLAAAIRYAESGGLVTAEHDDVPVATMVLGGAPAYAVLRLDCFAGNGAALVRYYQDAGFEPTDRFTVGDWPGQVLQKDVGS